MLSSAVFRRLLYCYPAAFRREYGREMVLDFTCQIGDARRQRDRLREFSLWSRAILDALTIAPQEHIHVIMQDVRYAMRTMAASPGFAFVAILSLALGIGANTAIFSLWNGVLRSSLPVSQPAQLVILTNPNSSGVSIGSQDGERSLMTYAEYEQLRDHSDSFSGLMASQSGLNRWQVRAENSGWDEAQGRMVSLNYFQVLGVTPAIGRAFAPSDGPDAPFAVISHNYWKRRFGGRTDILGKAITVRKASLTVLGVASAGFFGETSGQQPDLWVPLQQQPLVLPGRDWLRDTTAEKVMWLHVFGRLRPDVSLAQAQDRANAVFKAALESHYGSVLSPEAKRDFLNQKLRLRPAAAGASSVRGGFEDPLNILLLAVLIVLLISCGNLANLLLARGAARQREMALRLTLGAGRARLIRQLITESLVLALAGGLAGLAVAYVLQRGLVLLVTEVNPDFQMSFHLEPAVLLFTLAITIASALIFGIMPAWLATGTDPGESIKGQGRSSTSSGGQMRWGRVLVAAQLALSLPLLVGAGLLLRTLYNLRNTDVGYAKERLLVMRVDAQTAGYAKERRAGLLHQLLQEARLLPGVRAASFSENGLFSGRDSADSIQVEGYTPKGDNDRGARWDQVGPGYFTVLGVPLLAGRDVNEADQPGSPKVCVINEAFARKFFSGRNPIGMRITTTYADVSNTHYVAGVAKDFRTHRLRGEVDPRYFVPLTQPLGETDGAVFVIRTAGDPGPMLTAVRQCFSRIDPTLAILQAGTLDERLDGRMARERIMARLTLAFGLLAIVLAAVGLYGVLSYGVTRRRGEIGIRIAIGAEPRQVVRMILKETTTMVILGLLLGAGFAYAAARFIASQLFGLAPHDPVTIGSAIVLLLLVALTAAYLPARRASRLDPMRALRQE